MPLLSRATWLRIQQKLNQENAANPPALGPNVVQTWNPVLVRANSATAVGGSAVGDQCYDASVLLINSLVDDQEVGADVWLTVLDEKDTPTAPTVDKVYSCMYAGRFDPDPGGAGTDSRLRAFGVPIGGGSSLSSGSSTSTSTFTFATINTWEDIGGVLTDLSLPSSGTYILTTSILGAWICSGLGGRIDFMHGRLYDETAAAAISGTQTSFGPLDTTGVWTHGYVSIYKIYTVSAASIIRLECLLQGGPAYTTAMIGGPGATGLSGLPISMTWVKIA